MVYVLKVLIFICIFIGIYMILRLNNKKTEDIIKEIKESDKKNIKIKINNFNKLKNSKILNLTKDKLEQYGNPFNLTPLTFILLKIILALIVFKSISIQFNFLVGTLAGIAGFFFIDYIYYRNNKNDLDEIRLDLGDIYDLIALQTSTGTQLGIALSEAYTVAKCKRFKKALVELAAKINMTANINEALDDFNKKFKFTEVDIFVNSIKQALETGLTEKILDGQAKQVKRKNLSYISKQTSKIDIQVMGILLLIFFGAVALVILALGSEMSKGLTNIFS